ncbi:nucleoside triphosphate pyrophosphohydrolase [Pasteurellaceae bacterium HPA106]|uniref:nucleoside triphosphate pyrophosphohydrolase n=1 Tax=Spirabiliibacterium pneumoniae TaxID=221400 RepID=UPI001AADA51D|nr:nucleoside triphosphate pyrophosphohydrolase [Spirabiliibacterium pneumoniae]MBE2897261.1 nucleoside triphosphate pyrophosphohydrolase [Spirabiliibacterium pneumoniae]
MQSIEQLIEIMRQLRNPNGGCPWDLEQTYQSMIPNVLEESYEVVETLQTPDFTAMREELGDLLLQVIFLSQLANEDKQFNFDDVVSHLNQKLIFRHPHVFGEKQAQNGEEALKNWEAQKAQERLEKKQFSLLDDIPRALPALLRAEKLQKRITKLEQTALCREDLITQSQQQLQTLKGNEHDAQQLGQLLYNVVELCRQSGLKAESLLREENERREKAARQMEQQNS